MLLAALVACSGGTSDLPSPTDRTAPTGDTGGSLPDTAPPDPTHTGGATTPTAETAAQAEVGLTADPPPGVLTDPIDVTLTATDPSATVYYTLDGSFPDPATAAVATGPLRVDRNTVVRALAVGDLGEAAMTGIWVFLDPDAASFSSNLPLIVLWSTDPAPVVKVEEYTSYTMLAFEPDATGRVTWPRAADTWSLAGIKIHGSSTAGYPKRPWRLETWAPTTGRVPGPPVDQQLSLLGLPEDGDWILGAPLDFDRARMRNTFIYAVSRAVGRYAPRTEFAEVFVAERGERVGLDDYTGIYELTERIERGNDRVDVEELLPTDLYEPEVTGGWVFKEDRTGPSERGFTAGTAGGRLSFQQPFVYVDPDELTVLPEQADWLSDYLDEVGVALVSPGFTHPTTGHHYDQLLDVDAFIDHHILNVYAKNPDAIRLSGYYFKDRSGLLAAGPIWDFDRTMGCASDSRAADPTWWDSTNMTSDTTRMFDEAFYGGLFDDPVFRARYFARMDTLLRTTLQPASVDLLIDGYAARLQEASARDFQVWSAWPPRGGSLRAEVDLLKDWLAARHAWMSGCVTLPDPMTCRGN